MPQNLPTILPSSGGRSTPKVSVSKHAQDFSTTHLGQHKERKASAVSAHQAAQRRDFRKARTSIRGGQSTVSTSVNRPEHARRSFYHDEEDQDGARDYMREKHQRKLMKEKREEESKARKALKKRKGLHPGTGTEYKSHGPDGFKRQLSGFVRRNPSKYKHIKEGDRELFEDIVGKKMKHKTTGSKITRRDRVDMRRKVYKAYTAGTITKPKYKTFKQLIRQMN